MIVIDVGCADHEGEVSIRPLIERFHPDVLFGFDPYPSVVGEHVIDGTRVVVEKAAAWTERGLVGFAVGTTPTRSHVVTESVEDYVPCIDLAEFIRQLSDDDVVLKLDCEGSEYELLNHLIAEDVDRRLNRVLVEWHNQYPQSEMQADLENRIRCPLEEWA